MVFEGLVLTLLTGCGIVLALVLLTCHRILEIANELLAWIQYRDKVDGYPMRTEEMVSPTDMPLPKDLRNVIVQGDLSTGTFEGRQPWDVKEAEKV